MMKRSKKRNIDECEDITFAIKRLAIAPEDADDQTKPKRRCRTWLNKNNVTCNDNEHVNTPSSTSTELCVGGGKMKPRQRRENPYQKPSERTIKNTVSSSAPSPAQSTAPSPAPSSASAGAADKKVHTKDQDTPKVPPKNPISITNLESQISALLKSIRYSNNASKEVKTPDPATSPDLCLGGRKMKPRQRRNKSNKPYEKPTASPKNNIENDIVTPAPAGNDGKKKSNAGKRKYVSKKYRVELEMLCAMFGKLALQ